MNILNTILTTATLVITLTSSVAADINDSLVAGTPTSVITETVVTSSSRDLSGVEATRIKRRIHNSVVRSLIATGKKTGSLFMTTLQIKEANVYWLSKYSLNLRDNSFDIAKQIIVLEQPGFKHVEGNASYGNATWAISLREVVTGAKKQILDSRSAS